MEIEKSVQLSSCEPTRVGLVTNIFTPYKEAMLREMAKILRLKVYYCAHIERERSWKVEFSNAYDYEVLPGTTVCIGNRSLHFNSGLADRIRADNIDVVIVGEWANPTVAFAPFWLRLNGIPRLLWSGSSRLETSPVRILTYPLKRLIVAQYQGYIAYTNKAAEYVQQLGAPADKVTVAPVTVDTDYFAIESKRLSAKPGREALRQKFGIAKTEIAIVFVGQMTHRKGVDILIEAIATLRNPRVKVLLAGSGDERQQFEELAKKRDVLQQFTFLGHCSQEELVELYVSGDIFTLPSRKEPSGNVINEAMTVGLPAVVSDKIGCDCVSDGYSGYVFPSENVQAYAEALRTLVDNRTRRNDMGKMARNTIRDGFTIQYEAFMFAVAIQKTLNSLGRPFIPMAPIDSQLHRSYCD